MLIVLETKNQTQTFKNWEELSTGVARLTSGLIEGELKGFTVEVK